MKIEEAKIVLGIKSPFNRKEIIAEFKKLSKSLHPDSKNGNSEKFIELQIAKEALLTYLKESETRALTTITEEIVKSNKSEKRVGEAIEKIKTLELRRTNRILSFTRTAGIITTGFAIMSTNFVPVLTYILPNDTGLITTIFSFITLALGLIYLWFKQRKETIEENIEDLKFSIENKSNYIEILKTIIKSNKTGISKLDFDILVEKWKKKKSIDEVNINISLTRFNEILSKLKIVNPYDISSLIIQKGIEYDIIVEEKILIDDQISIKYKIKN